MEPNPGPDNVSEEEPDPVGTTVVKIGGSTLGDHDTALIDLVAMQRAGAQPVVVHGGGKVISDWMGRQGVRPRFVGGLRVTDRRSLEIVIAVLSGLVNKTLVASIQRMGGKAIGLSGVDGGMLQAMLSEPELGLVGSVFEVRTDPIRAVTGAGFMPVIASVAINAGASSEASDTVLNVNADTAAGEIASALGADRLVFLTDVEGVVDSSRRVIPRLTEGQARRLMRSGVVAGGMLPKIGACLRALDRVESTHIVDGRKPHALRDALAGLRLGTRVG